MSFLKENKIFLAIIFSGIIIASAVYFGLKTNKPVVIQEPSLSITVTPTQVLIPTSASTPEENISPTITSSIKITGQTPTLGVPYLNEDQIKKGLLAKTIIPEEKLEFQIGERRDRENKILIRGAVKNKDEEHGAGFFAYCDLQKCEVTFVGQEVPKCSEVNPYGYPLDWADYCLDEKGEVIKR